MHLRSCGILLPSCFFTVTDPAPSQHLPAPTRLAPLGFPLNWAPPHSAPSFHLAAHQALPGLLLQIWSGLWGSPSPSFPWQAPPLCSFRYGRCSLPPAIARPLPPCSHSAAPASLLLTMRLWGLCSSRPCLPEAISFSTLLPWFLPVGSEAPRPGPWAGSRTPQEGGDSRLGRDWEVGIEKMGGMTKACLCHRTPHAQEPT